RSTAPRRCRPCPWACRDGRNWLFRPSPWRGRGWRWQVRDGWASMQLRGGRRETVIVAHPPTPVAPARHDRWVFTRVKANLITNRMVLELFAPRPIYLSGTDRKTGPMTSPLAPVAMHA